MARCLPEMYRKGIIRGQVIALQCIGFNKCLDDLLHGRVIASKEATPDAALDDDCLAADLKGCKRTSEELDTSEESSEGEDKPQRKAAKV